MPRPFNPYTDPDLVRALYTNPANSVLLAEYILSSGVGAAMGITSSGADAAGPGGYGAGGGYDGGGFIGGCFTAATMIWMADGSYKPISMIEKDVDVVMAFNEAGELSPEPVTKVWVRDVDSYALLRVGDKVTGTTHDHQFWLGGAVFKPLRDIGKHVIRYVDGRWDEAPITSLETVNDTISVYNLSIKNHRTYIPDGYGVSNLKPPPE